MKAKNKKQNRIPRSARIVSCERVIPKNPLPGLFEDAIILESSTYDFLSIPWNSLLSNC
jgi:hypothetical protein